MKVNEKMKLYHYSNEDLTVIDPLKFGNNSHTPKDSIEPRAYYYLNKEYREKFFLGSKYRYTVVTHSDKIYDLSTDYRGLFGLHSIDEIINILKRSVFIGLKFTHPCGIDIVCLFHLQKVVKKEVL